ncbi:MAG: hypothetical protein C0501_23815 [Isosphaera sp.]|nr:hypothetical protein [Isosphaera sp.]
MSYRKYARALSVTGDLYRTSGYRGGLFLASATPNVPSGPVNDPATLAALTADRLRIRRTKGGKVRGNSVPPQHLKTALVAECFLQQFRPVDRVDTASRYVHLAAPDGGDDFHLTMPGYFDGGPRRRVLHTGAEPEVSRSLDFVQRFLEVMAFQSAADRTNAVAAAITVLLRDAWPGGKPLLAVTSTKSHGGKDTVIAFAAGVAPRTAISYQETDWALESNLVRAVKFTPGIGVLVVENARLDGTGRYIRSAILERFLTDPEPLLGTVGTGVPVRLRNDLVFAVSTNDGRLSEDLMNRALPIRLAPRGDVADRRPAIGNPKLEYLPANRGRIEAELRGMVERWREAGRPLDNEVRHPFSPWAATVGGILKASGFEHFLANYSQRRTSDDPVKDALGLLGASSPDRWLTAGEWARKVVELGLVRRLIPEGDRDTDAGRQRGIGIVFTAHDGETYAVETDDLPLTLRLEKARRRFDGPPSTRYRFLTVDTTPPAETP